MRVLITGSGGQLAQSLIQNSPVNIELVTLTRNELDVSDMAVAHRVISEVNPKVIINTAAYTDVELAETNSDKVYDVNALGAENVAKISNQIEAKLIHISTDYVFDGQQSIAYKPGDTTNPLSIYGKSKLLGEVKVAEATAGQAIIIRTSWLYSMHGKNFLRTILSKLKARENLMVIDDQIGTPTSTESLAEFVWETVLKDIRGIYHWSNSGVTSWYDFAVAIYEEAVGFGKIDTGITIVPCKTKDYFFKAERPAFSVLDKTETIKTFGKVPPHWRECLRDVIRLSD